MKQTGTGKKTVISALLVLIALILLIQIFRPTAVLYGKVVDQSGQPVPNAELTCIPYAWSRSKSLTPVVVQSAPDGTFLFKEPDCSGARIAARAPGYRAFTPSYGSYTFPAIPNHPRMRPIPKNRVTSAF
jgi:hypothetical protein